MLSVPRVGIHDNFFDLGGHSLLVVQVLAHVREVLGRNLPITDVFRFPSVRALAGYLGGGDRASTEALDSSEERGSARRGLLERRRARQR